MQSDLIKELREAFIAEGKKPWSNITLSIVNFKFSIEYNYEDLKISPYTSDERHIIWKCKYIQKDINTYTKKEKELLNRYLRDKKDNKIERYSEGVYKNEKRNILGYNIKKYEIPPEEDIIEKNQILNVKKN